MPSSFPSCPCTVSWLGRVAPLAGTTLCRFSNNGTAGHYTASEPTSSLNWGVPSLAIPLNAHVAGRHPGPFPWVPAPTALPTRPMAPRAPHQRVTRAHYAIPAPHGPLAYRGRLARGTHSAILTVHSHAPNPSTGLLHPSKQVSSLHSHQQQNDSHFVNLTNPLTSLYN